MTISVATELRRYTTAEIAAIVCTFRETLGWKQITLAVSDATLKKIALALRLDADHFAVLHVIKTPEQLQREADELLKQYTTVELTQVSTGRALTDILQDCGACAYDAPESAGIATQEQIAAFFDYARDIGDIWRELPFTERVEQQTVLTALIGGIEAAGYAVSAGVRHVVFKHAGHAEAHEQGR